MLRPSPSAHSSSSSSSSSSKEEPKAEKGLVRAAAQLFLDRNRDADFESFAALLRNSSDLQPRLLVSEGCSGSSVAISLLKEMMKEHGTRLDYFYNTELFKCEKNPECVKHQKGGDLHGMRVAVAKAVAAGTTLVLKTQGGGNPAVLQAVYEMGAYAVVAYRSNVLARLLCAARDCFPKLVRDDLETDAQTDLVRRVGPNPEACFERRRLPAAKQTKVWLNPEGGKLVETLRALERDRDKLVAKLTEAGFADEGSFAVVTTEALFESEADGSIAALHRTALAWEETLTSLGIKANRGKILAVLEPQRGARPSSSSYASISNAEEVLETLHKWLETATATDDSHYEEMVGHAPQFAFFESLQ